MHVCVHARTHTHVGIMKAFTCLALHVERKVISVTRQAAGLGRKPTKSDHVIEVMKRVLNDHMTRKTGDEKF